jgi:signal transduction histidine kinase
VAGLEQASGRTVEVTVEVEPDVTVQADPDAVVTVVDHLLENAVKYSPGGGTIAVSIAHGPGTTVQFAVSDDGIGMDDVALEHCFDKFWQSQVGDRRRFGGTGIGLYIVASLVEAMGGTVTVDSRLGAGSTFTVTLHVVSPTTPAPAPVTAGERSMVREFMRQIGVGSDER